MTSGRDSDTRGQFAISVAAERAEMQIQNLRVYERRGLLEPARTSGGTRLYSEADIAILQRISTLLSEGLNLAGIGRVLALEKEVHRLRTKLGERIGSMAGQHPDARASTLSEPMDTSPRGVPKPAARP